MNDWIDNDGTMPSVALVDVMFYDEDIRLSKTPASYAWRKDSCIPIKAWRPSCPGENRIDVIAQNGNDGDHYRVDDKMIDISKAEKYYGKLKILSHNKEADYLLELAQDYKRVNNKLNSLRESIRKKKDLDEMVKVCKGLKDNTDCCIALYEAGYRKDE